MLSLSYHSKTMYNSKGNALMVVIFSLVIFSSLSGVMVSMFSTSTESQLDTHFAESAYMLSESGYRYIASRYKQATTEVTKNQVLENNHQKIFKLGNSGSDGQFELSVYPYYYRVVQANAGNTMILRFPGGMPPGYTIPTTGTLGIYGSDSKYKLYNYTNVVGPDGNSVFNFTLHQSTLLTGTITPGTTVVAITYPPSNPNVANGGSLIITNPNIFPQSYGVFEIVDTTTLKSQYVYQYSSRSEINGVHKLNEITVLGDYAAQAFPFNTTDKAIAVHTSVMISSKGKSPQGATSVFERTACLGGSVGGNTDNVADGGETIMTSDFTGLVASVGNYDVTTTGQARQNAAIEIRSEEVVIRVNWQNSSNVANLSTARSNNQGLLSYALQVKIKLGDRGTIADQYMIGLSFRLDTHTTSGNITNCYGVSFFRVNNNTRNQPDWVTMLDDRFDEIRNDNLYLVLWIKQNGSISRIAHKRLDEISYPNVVSDDEINEWSSIIVKIEEFEELNGDRYNEITTYVQGENIYGRGIVNWNYPLFDLVEWNNGSSVIEDNRLTSESFDATIEEIGIHSFLDSPGQNLPRNTQFFDDFAMKVEGAGSGSSAITPGM
ncbi:MAG: hypothetical protein HQK77_10755 [Desulfobacterales bacterium]|nr:hypothetical protein [Desulfobacterales bacterium]